MEKILQPSFWNNWKRPASFSYPNTWHRFSKKSQNGKIYNIKIVDLTPDRFEDAVEFTAKYFSPNEPLSKCLETLGDEISIHNFQLLGRTVFDQHVSLIAVIDEDIPKPEIVGIQRLYIDVKGYESPKLPGDYLQKLTKLFEKAESNHNPFEIFNADTIIRGFGLGVKSEYSGLDIGYNLILSIEKLAKAFGIEAFVAYYTNIRSQKIVEKIGFKFLNEIIYNEYKDDQGQVVFPVEGTKSLKFMGIKYV